MQSTTKQLQLALQQAGFNPGIVDGDWGPNTRKAYNAWQRKTGLTETPVPSQADLAVLLRVTIVPAPQLPWMDEALKLFGLKEGPGKANNPLILEWGDQLEVYYPNDDIAWCGLFIAHTMRTALPDEPLPTNMLGARQYQKFGFKVDPQLGAVGVFWRGTKDGWLGHVGYLAGDTGNAYTVLGGNQSDSVSYTNVAKSRLLGAYWPVTGPKPYNLKLPARPEGKLSTNEA